MRCPGCGSIINRPDARFCGKCGYDLTKNGMRPGNGGSAPGSGPVPDDNPAGSRPSDPAGPVRQNPGTGGFNNNGRKPDHSSRILIMIIILLLILVLGMAGYLVYTIMHGLGNKQKGPADSVEDVTGEDPAGPEENTDPEDPENPEDPGGQDDQGDDGETGGTGGTNKKITYEDLVETNPVSEQAVSLNPTAIGYNGHAYALVDNKEYGLSYQELQAYCVKMGGHLAVINDAEENFVLYMLAVRNGQQTAFFGYSDEAVEGSWQWAYGNSDYERWNADSGQPDNGGAGQGSHGENYAQFMVGKGDGTWNDAQMDVNTTVYICEWEADASVPDQVDPPKKPAAEKKDPVPETNKRNNAPPEIFPDSSNTYLTDAQVNSLSADDVQKAINEIYARNGYRFKDPAWLAYYEQYDWYNGTIPYDKFDAAKELNAVEFANVEKLSKRRDALKSRGG